MTSNAQYKCYVNCCNYNINTMLTFCPFFVLSHILSCLLIAIHGLYSPPGPSVHVILPTQILEWVAIPFSRGSPWPRDQTWVSCIGGSFFTIWATKQLAASGKFKFCFLELSGVLPPLTQGWLNLQLVESAGVEPGNSEGPAVLFWIS